MTLVLAIAALMLSATPSAVLVQPAGAAAEAEVRQCASKLGSALELSDPAALREILPARGKVQLRLVGFGLEEGAFSAGQVEALFSDFFKRASVESFELLRVEHDRSGYALVKGRAEIVDRSGRRERIDLHLALQPEGETWVLREIRETQR